MRITPLLPLALLFACQQDIAVIKHDIDNDNDGYNVEVDCDDGRADINPEADEVCDGEDNDCDGEVDGEAIDAGTWYGDADGDGHGDAATATRACEAPAGAVQTHDDCDDAEPAAFPGNPEVCDGIDNDCNALVDDAAADVGTWYADGDGDGHGDTTAGVSACEAPAGHVASDDDCDDTNEAIHPEANESDCTDPVDYNCDGSVGYADNDGDGVAACEDCDDAEAGRSPLLTEVCDELDLDEDCDGLADDLDDSTDTAGMPTWYRDADADGYHAGSGTSVSQCEALTGYSDVPGDCDDYDSGANPGATEVCDRADTDEDCDGMVDDADPTVDSASWLTWYRDADGDTYGDASRSVGQCAAPADYVSDNTDCDDTDARRSPGLAEVCDAADTDEDCDGLADDADTDADGLTAWYADTDGDGYGDAGAVVQACDEPATAVADDSDCDDSDGSVNPGAAEVCDAANIDEDCDSTADDDDASVASSGKSTWYRDGDADGHGGTSTTTRCDLPSGYTAASTDCDDADADTFPGAAPLDSASACMNDDDGDNHGDATVSGSAVAGTDCDDTRSAVSPAGSETCSTAYDDDCDGSTNDLGAIGCIPYYQDGDSDGYGLLAGSQCLCSATGDYDVTGVTSATDDCNDALAAINPGATELCDAANTDEDCDGLADDADPDADGLSEWYADSDADGYGDPAAVFEACDEPATAVADDGDCDDSDGSVNPAAAEVCDAANTDEDCDTVADDADPSVASSGMSTWYRDGDSDGHGGTSAASRCDLPSGYTAASTDCDDADANSFPGAAPLDSAVACMNDDDGDNHGDATVSGSVVAGTDCDDSRSAVSPAGSETCSTAYDDDCDGSTNDLGAIGCTTYYFDGDSDGYGLLAGGQCMCTASGDHDVTGVTSATDDCDDALASINPGAAEVCDSADTDEDCDGLADDDDSAATGKVSVYTDADGDGYGAGSAVSWCDAPSGTAATSTDCDDASSSINPAATEVCGNGDDDNCDGSTDEGCPTMFYSGDYAAEYTTTTSTDADAVIYGEASADYFGEGIVSDVDFDGDGIGNFAVSGSGNLYLSSYYGSIYVYDGMPTGAADAEAANVARIYGGGTSTYMIPEAIWKIEDFDGDGRDELAAMHNFSGTSYVYIHEGEDLASAFSFGSTYTYYDRLTMTGPVSGLGDENSTSGTNEVGVADWDASGAQGAVYIYNYGTSGLSTLATVNGEDPGDAAGFGLAGGEGNDPNGDGYDDVFIGAYGDDGGGSNAGAAYVVEAPVTSTFDLSSAQVKITGGAAGDGFGYVVVAPGDMDGDGRADLLVTAPDDDDGGTDAGVVFVFADVNTDGATKDNDSTDFEVKIIGDNASDSLGEVQPAVGDVNGDGEVDILLGAPGWDNGTATGAGAAWLLYGPLSGTYDLSSASDYDARFLGDGSNDACGSAVGLGDLQADGTEDLLVGCSAGDAGAYTGRGTVYFFAGG